MCSEKYFSLVMDHHFCLPFSVSFYGNISLYMEIYGYIYIYMVVYMAIYMVVYMVMDTYMIYIYRQYQFFLYLHTVHRYKL